MESTNEPKKLKESKSTLRHPKIMNTFVVDFGDQGALDEKPKMITANKRNLEQSVESSELLSSPGSATTTKTFTITAVDNLTHPLIVSSISEVKIDMLDDNQCGDADRKSPQTSNYPIVDTKMGDKQPIIIFDSSKNIKKIKESRRFLKKKPKKYKSVVKFKNGLYKYKNPTKNITRKLEKYYVKAKIHSHNTEHIEQIYSNTIIISRSTILKKVLAKENLLETDQVSMFDVSSLNDNDDGSLKSSSTAKKMPGYASQNTLVNKSFFSMNSDDLNSIKPVSSIVAVSSDILPYKTDIVNIAVAVAPKSNNIQFDRIPCNDECFDEENIASTDKMSFNFTNVELTSETPSEDSAKIEWPLDNLIDFKLNETDLSNTTLTGFEKTLLTANSGEDATKIAQTCSDVNKSNLISNSEVKCNSETLIQSKNLHNNLHSFENLKLKNNESIEDDLDTVLKLDFFPEMKPHSFENLALKNNESIEDDLDTVLKLDSFPEMKPSTSFGCNFDNDFNKTIVTNNVMINNTQTPKKKGNAKSNLIQNELSRNILLEPFDLPNDDQRNEISLPNQVAIKAVLKNTDKIKSQLETCSEEVRNNYLPSDLTEMWDRLTLVLDLAVKRLEDSLAEKIVREIKQSLSNLIPGQKKKMPKPVVSLTEVETEEIKTEKHDMKMLHKEEYVREERFSTDKSLQCNLVQDRVIDQIMLRLSVEGPQPVPSLQLPLKQRPRVIRDYSEVIKPPLVSDVEVGKAETVAVATTTGQDYATESRIFERIRALCSSPMLCFRENLLIITSVPTFFIILFCLYGVSMLSMKPW